MKHFYYILATALLAIALTVVLSAHLVGRTLAHSEITYQAQGEQQSQEIAQRQNTNDAIVYVWASDLFVHDCPSTSCGTVDQISRNNVSDACQEQAEVVTAEGYTNNWWSYIRTPGGINGWISNIYIRGNAVIAGVPFC